MSNMMSVFEYFPSIAFMNFYFRKMFMVRNITGFFYFENIHFTPKKYYEKKLKNSLLKI